MVQPQGFAHASQSHLVYKLNKALYGLEIAPEAWFSTFSTFLLSQNFVPSQCDSSLFVLKTPTSITILLIYDILLTGSDPLYIAYLIQQIHATFSMKELGFVNYFLGISVTKTFVGYVLSQQKYASKILAKAGMNDCKSYSSPMAIKVSTLSFDADLPLSQPSIYRSLVGALQYLTITRPNLASVVNHVCQFMQALLNSHFASVKRLLRYIKGILGRGLHFSSGSLILNAYSDSDWAKNVLDRRSTTGYCAYLGLNLISWSAKKQPTVSRSSSEAEYRALAHASIELSWLGMLLAERHCPVPVPTLWCDNLSAIAMSHNPVFHARTIHIEVDYHFVRERIAAKKLHICYIPTTDQITDIFTKPLSVARFQYLQSKLLVLPSPMSLRGNDKRTAPEQAAPT
ncbi:uncharacterized protein LOC114257489 [Camellia sinensis]|uniref:uncharacterized protein LOC114257489 n=1 Tax=Camellia sinensis TaxID=4442 RepID=UPI0010363AB9|nr:uncharacterized protein LOC114257489 [Camellia sinensis]